MSTDNPADQIELDEHCKPAWDAYKGMFESKQQHYEFLEVLENKKKKFNLSPTQDDEQKLADFLTQHDTQVKAFTHLSMELKATKPESHQRLFEFIAQLGDGEPTKKIQH